MVVCFDAVNEKAEAVAPAGQRRAEVKVQFQRSVYQASACELLVVSFVSNMYSV